MAPTRNTAHLHRANGKSACGRLRGLFTPYVFYVIEFQDAMRTPEYHVCRYCLAAYHKLAPGSKKHRQ